jgi:hypothetical protein
MCRWICHHLGWNLQMILTSNKQLNDTMRISEGGVPLLTWLFYMLVWYLGIIPLFLCVMTTLLLVFNHLFTFE